MMCSTVYQYRAVTLHYYSVGLVAKNISENQEVELLLLSFFGYLEPTWQKKNKNKKKINQSINQSLFT